MIGPSSKSYRQFKQPPRYHMKEKIFKAYVESALTYGTEAWAIKVFGDDWVSACTCRNVEAVGEKSRCRGRKTWREYVNDDIKVSDLQLS